MKDALQKAVESNATKSAGATTADEAMKYAQAALNLSNAFIGLSNLDKK